MPGSESNNWQRAEVLFHRAAELKDEERTNYLLTACEGDEGLFNDVASMLESFENPTSFLEDTLLLRGLEILDKEREQPSQGTRLGRYEIIKRIGSGGMGEVFLAHDSLLDRKVALKLLPTLLTNDPSRVRRFEQEAHAASTISHPNIAHIYEVGVDGSYHFTSMEFVDGLTLRAVLNQRRLGVLEALEIAVQVCSALVSAHATGVVHRDIKPENIMIRPDGYVKVLDFGLAKFNRVVEPQDPRQTSIATMVLTEPGLIVGSPAYMSPEQARGMDVDARTDIWSLGVVLYEMLCGWTPFRGATNMDVIAALLREEPTPISLVLRKAPPGLHKVLKRMLSKDRDERYGASSEVLTDLQHLIRDLRWYVKSDRISARFSRAWFLSLKRKASATASRRDGMVIKAPIPLFITTIILGVALTWSVRSFVGHRALQNNAESFGHYEKAVEAIYRDDPYTAARELDVVTRGVIVKQSLMAHARLAEVWAELDYSDKADFELKQLVALESDLSGAAQLTTTDIHYAKAARATVARDFLGALEVHKRIAEEFPTNVNAWMDLGLSYERLLRWEEAANSYRRAIDIDQSKASAFFRLGMVEEVNKNVTSATDAFERASQLYRIRSDPDALQQVLLKRSVLAKKYGRRDDAQSLEREAFGLHRYDSFSLLRRDMELAIAAHSDAERAKAYERGFRRTAERISRTGLLSRGPDQLLVEGLLAIGFLYLHDNDLLNAQKYFLEAATIARRSDLRISRAKAVFARGQQYLYEGFPEQADRSFKEVLAIELPGKNYSDQIISQWRSTIRDTDYDEAIIKFKNTNN